MTDAFALGGLRQLQDQRRSVVEQRHAGNWSTSIGTPTWPINTTTGDLHAATQRAARRAPPPGAATRGSRNDFTDTQFRVRAARPSRAAASARRSIWTCSRSRVYWSMATTTSTTTAVTSAVPDQDLQGPGTVCAGSRQLLPRRWRRPQSARLLGDDEHRGRRERQRRRLPALLRHAHRVTNPAYDADTYYNYAVEVPAGASGSVYVYDPVFCATAASKGTGDRWFSGAGDAVSSFYELYDTQNTLYDPTRRWRRHCQLVRAVPQPRGLRQLHGWWRQRSRVQDHARSRRTATAATTTTSGTSSRAG